MTINLLKKQNQKTEIEQELPNILYSMASATSFQTMQELFFFASNANGELGKTFKRMYLSAKNGRAIPKIINEEIKHSPSNLFSQALEILKQGYSSGADISELLTDLADDISQSTELQNKRQAITAIETYTLVLSCALLVPFILGLIFSVVKNMNFNGLSEWGFGGGVVDKQLLLHFALISNHVYLTIYALMVAFFLSYQRGNFSKILPMSLAMIIISNTIFVLMRAFIT